MREIKFRAWVKEVYEEIEGKREFAYGGYMIEPHQMKSILLNNVSSLMNGPKGTGIEYFEQGSFLPGWGSLTRLKFDEIELMQYTGLKDRNGKEIYEGDVVRFNILMNSGSYEEYLKEFEVPVVYEDGCYGVDDRLLRDVECEVICNIYESKLGE